MAEGKAEFRIQITIDRLAYGKNARAKVFKHLRDTELVLSSDHSYVREFLLQQLGLAFADAMVEIATRDFE